MKLRREGRVRWSAWLDGNSPFSKSMAEGRRFELPSRANGHAIISRAGLTSDQPLRQKMRAGVSAPAQHHRCRCLTTKLSDFRLWMETSTRRCPASGEPQAKPRYSRHGGNANLQNCREASMPSNDPSSATASKEAAARKGGK